HHLGCSKLGVVVPTSTRSEPATVLVTRNALTPFKPGPAQATKRPSVCGTAAHSGCSFSLTEPTNFSFKPSSSRKLSAELFPLSKINVVSGTVSVGPDNSRKN